MTVNTEGLLPADVLAALYNSARPQGMGFLHYTPEPMTREEAQVLLDAGAGHYVDYLHGRVMKVSLEDPTGFEARLYDRDNGDGAAAEAIAALRQTGRVTALGELESPRERKVS